MAKKTQKVLCDPEGEGERVGFYLRPAGDKDIIQVGDRLYELGYREPEDRDAGGSGKTWWLPRA